MYTVESIEEKLRVGGTSPHELADMRAFLASAYSFHTGQLQEILEKKAHRWLEMRATLKSDTATDRTWDATQDGVDEMKLRLAIKRIEKLSSAIKSLLQVAEGEARNQY
jgi:hypothetical protein